MSVGQPNIAYQMLVSACRAEVENRGFRFNLTAEFDKHLKDISQWLASDDPTFGLFLCGGAGNGKTTIVKALQNLVGYLNESRQIEDRFNSGCIIVNAKELNRLAKAFYNPSRDTENEAARFRRLKNIEILAIDDLGTEPRETMYYGDYITPVIDILTERYDRQACTIVTTNLDAKDIATVYDGRIYDRFREMMKIINFSNETSFRGRHMEG